MTQKVEHIQTKKNGSKFEYESNNLLSRNLTSLAYRTLAYKNILHVCSILRFKVAMMSLAFLKNKICTKIMWIHVFSIGQILCKASVTNWTLFWLFWIYSKAVSFWIMTFKLTQNFLVDYFSSFFLVGQFQFNFSCWLFQFIFPCWTISV